MADWDLAAVVESDSTTELATVLLTDLFAPGTCAGLKGSGCNEPVRESILCAMVMLCRYSEGCRFGSLRCGLPYDSERDNSIPTTYSMSCRGVHPPTQ